MLRPAAALASQLGLSAWLTFVAHRLLENLTGDIGWNGVFWLFCVANLALWYLLDVWEPRDTIYQRYGLEEAVINPLCRHLRLMLAILLGLGAVFALLLTGLRSLEGAGPTTGSVAPFALLAAASLATLGWLMTNFQNQKAHRIAHTLQANRDVFHADRYADRRLRIAQAVRKLKAWYPEAIPSDAIPSDFLDIRWGRLMGNSVDPAEGQYPFRFMAVEWINQLEQVAFGVRSGQIDYNAVEQTMRSTYLRTYANFEPYILKVCKAPVGDMSADWRARSKTYEHFIWLVSKLVKNHDRVPERGWLKPCAGEPKWLSFIAMNLVVFDVGLAALAMS